MMKNTIYIVSVFVFLSACGGIDTKQLEKNITPNVTDNGTLISFPNAESTAFFKTEKVNSSNIEAELNAPGRIAATVLASGLGASQNIVLFDNLELASSYTQLIQQQINISQIQNVSIKQKQIELDRIKDLLQNGAATGQELLNAQTALSMEQTNLANERSALIEHETKLISGGFEPEVLHKARTGKAFIICDIPENQISKIKEGQTCKIVFTAFPNEKYTGNIDAITDMVDNATRMVKVRITVNNATNKLKSGMFANISFSLSEGKFISISNTSMITVQGKHYVFVKKSATDFERKEIQTGQQIGERIIVFSGINTDEEIAIEGVLQLKGLSFGY